jgi:ABC-type sugar transport system substrate-binding protein
MSMVSRASLALLCVTILLLNMGSDASAAEKIVIGFSQATMNSTWRVAMTEGNKKYTAEHYPEVELASPTARTRLPSRSVMWKA